MPTFRLHKIVRDKLVDDMVQSGQRPVYHVLGLRQHCTALIAKLKEEADELLDAPDAQKASELADLQQIIDDLVTLYNVPPAAVAQELAAKRRKRGGFMRGIFVETVEPHEGSYWAEYYRRTPDKSPEITD